MGFLHRSWNTGNLLVLLGTLALVLTFVWPYLAAERVARIESWAERISRALLQTAERTAVAVDEPDAGTTFLTAIENAGYADRLSPLAPPEGLDPGIYFEGKHYYYAVTRAAADEPGAEAPLEVLSWPRSPLGPTRTVFFFPARNKPSYTHNLRQHYAGLSRVPHAGVARPQVEGDAHNGSYRGRDGEHWIVLPPRGNG